MPVSPPFFFFFFFFSPLLLSFSPSSFFPLSFLSFFSFLFPSSSFCYPPLSLLPFGAVTMENTQSRKSSKIMKINWKTKQRRPRPPSAAIKTGVRKTEPKNGAFAIGIQFFFFFFGLCVSGWVWLSLAWSGWVWLILAESGWVWPSLAESVESSESVWAWLILSTQ